MNKIMLSTPLLNLMCGIFKYLSVNISISYTIDTYFKVFLWSISFVITRSYTAIVIVFLNITTVRKESHNFVVSSLSLLKTRSYNLISFSPYINSIITATNVFIVIFIFNYSTRRIEIVILSFLFYINSQESKNLLLQSLFSSTQNICRNTRSSMNFRRYLDQRIRSENKRTLLNKSCQLCYLQGFLSLDSYSFL